MSNPSDLDSVVEFLRKDPEHIAKLREILMHEAANDLLDFGSSIQKSSKKIESSIKRLKRSNEKNNELLEAIETRLEIFVQLQKYLEIRIAILEKRIDDVTRFLADHDKRHVMPDILHVEPFDQKAVAEFDFMPPSRASQLKRLFDAVNADEEGDQEEIASDFEIPVKWKF